MARERLIGTIRPWILIVDDDLSVLQALNFALDIEGFHVETCDSGEALLARPAPPPPDCLVVDQRLPGISGVEALTVLRERGVNTPAILITTAPGPALEAQARSMGVRIVEKPLAGGELPAAIRAILA
jgi:DNA-binding response OmpR family regulator